jgi:crotonobetainyl-CoA:carnitine CoA-transferase CaiB-like acyl-CoA transferase
VTAGPLDGVTVLAAEQMHSLPHATQLMALMGAEVIKVEPVGGEAGRAGRPVVTDSDGRPTGSTFLRNNLGKQSVGLDLKADAGRALFLQLAATVDVVAENFRPGTADGLGIGYDAVRAVNPAVIYVSVSGFGNRLDHPSPYRQWAAYAPIVEGMAGLYEYSRDANGPPRPALAGALGDTGPGLYAVIGVLAALHQRGRTGGGSYVDIAMYDAMIAIADVVHPASMGVDPSRATEGIGILHAFRARDGWFTVEVVREAHFPRFAEAVGHGEWVDDERLATRSGWSAHMDTVIRPGVEAWASAYTKAEAAALLAVKGVAAGPVNTAADIVADSHVAMTGLVHTIPVDGGSVDVVGNPIRFSPPTGGPGPEPRWPTLGSGTDRVLEGRLGLRPDQIEALRSEGAIK